MFLGAVVEKGLGMSAELGPPGHIVVRAPLGGAVRGADGSVSKALLSVASDAATGLAVYSSLDWEAMGTTAELRVDLLGEPSGAATMLEATGRLLGRHGDFGTAVVDIRDDLGNVLAHSVGIMSIDRVPRSAWRARHPDPSRLFDPDCVRVVPSGPGESRVRPVGGMLNSMRLLHGGVLMALADAAQDALLAEEPAGRFRRVRLGVDYLRPARADSELVFRSMIRRAGRRLRTVQTEISEANGKLVAIATGTTVALPDPA